MIGTEIQKERRSSAPGFEEGGRGHELRKVGRFSELVKGAGSRIPQSLQKELKDTLKDSTRRNIFLWTLLVSDFWNLGIRQ